MNENSNLQDIDFVVTWVDGSDPEWNRKRAEYLGEPNKKNAAVERYRDWDILRYWFRGVEKYAPWVRNVYFVTDNQCPEWLNINHPKLKMVDHKDFIPSKYLPTFNSNAIEWHMHRIEGLSEQFVYFNDDMLLIDHVKPQDFFRDGMPCDSEYLRIAFPRSSFDMIRFNTIEMINHHFSPREVMKKDWIKWIKYKSPLELFLLILLGAQKSFSGISASHICIPFLKSTFHTLWEKEPEMIEKTCTHKQRTRLDVSIWACRYWQMCSGKFFPQKHIGKLFHTYTIEKGQHAIKYISEQKGKVICINDTEQEKNYQKHKEMVIQALNKILPDKSAFEI